MADFLKHTFTKKTQFTTSQVNPHGESEAKSGTGAKNTPFKVDAIPPGGSPEPKKGTGGTNDFNKFKRDAATPITTSAISAAK